MNESATTEFVEQPLALPGTAYKLTVSITNIVPGKFQAGKCFTIFRKHLQLSDADLCPKEVEGY